ncbi:MAG: PAS domain-containing protein [Betaproteobacteria bacterium]|nr:PAS domain-containing protein [Betaproteobacteria bacterium]
MKRWIFNPQNKASHAQAEPDWAVASLEILKQGMVVIDAKGFFRKVNLSACEILGFDASELMGQSYMVVAPPEIQLNGDRFLAGLLRHSEKIRSHWVLRHKNGNYLTVTAGFKTQKSAVFGACVLIVFAIDDKSDPVDLARRAQSERDASHMALSYGMLQQVINSIPARIAYFDCKTLQCIFGNEAFAIGHSQPVKALHGKPLESLLLPATWAFLKPYYERATCGQTTKFDHTENDLPAAVRHFQCHLLPPFARNGQQIGVFALSVDITAHQQIEMALRESEARLHNALNAEKELGDLKTAFVSMASHELRTPLTNIQTSSDLLQHYAEKLSPEEKAECLKDIQDAVNRMRLVMENVLVFAKLGTNSHVYQPTRMPIDSLVRQLVAEVDAADGHEHLIELKAPEGGDTLQAQLDEALMRQIVGNLVSNACKYSPRASTVTVVWWRQETVAAPAQLRLEVTDQGIGIPVDDIPKLFDNFHRASNVGKIPGTGLGLPIVKRALESLGGSIEVFSSSGTGSRFAIHLPWVD